MAEGDRDKLASDELEDFVFVMMLAKGNTIEYVVPSFLELVDLVEVIQVKLQWEDGETREVATSV